MRPTSCLTGFWRCEVPITAAPADGQVRELLGADPGGPGAEAPVGGLQLVGDLQECSDPVMRLLGIVGIYMPRRAAVDAVASRWSNPPVSASHDG